MKQDIKNNLEKAGLAGIAMFALYIIFIMAGNHIDHSTQAMIQNTAAFIRLDENIENNNRVIEQNTNVLRSLEQTILLKIQ